MIWQRRGGMALHVCFYSAREWRSSRLQFLHQERCRSGRGSSFVYSSPLDAEDATARALVAAGLQYGCGFERVGCTSTGPEMILCDIAADTAVRESLLVCLCFCSYIVCGARVLYGCFSSIGHFSLPFQHAHTHTKSMMMIMNK